VKKAICLIVLLNLVILGWSQDLVVAVTDFTARSGYTEDELSDITELFAGFLRDTGVVRVVTRSQWEAILKEHVFQRGGLVAQTEIRELGVALGAQAVITGSLMKLGNSNVLNLSLLDVQSGEMLSAARNAFESLDDFLKLLPALSNDVVKLIPKPNLLLGKWQAIVNGRPSPCYMVFQKDGKVTITGLQLKITWVERAGFSGSKTYSLFDYELSMKNANANGLYSSTTNSIDFSLTVTGDRYNKNISQGYKKTRRDPSGERKGSPYVNSDKTETYTESVVKRTSYSIRGDRLILNNFLVAEIDSIDKVKNSIHTYEAFEEQTYGTATASNVVINSWGKYTEYKEWQKVQ
jgi:TolB-like protein